MQLAALLSVLLVALLTMAGSGSGSERPRGQLGDVIVASDHQRETVLAGPSPLRAAPITVPGCSDDRLEITARNVRRAQAAALCVVNKVRVRNGRLPLRLHTGLSRAARSHAVDMVRQRFFSHVSPSGTTATARIRRTGYMLHLRGWAIGENLAWGTGSFSTPANIVQAWLDSPGHKRNLLDRRWRETGISVVVGSPVDGRGLNAGTYAQTFGVRRR